MPKITLARCQLVVPFIQVLQSLGASTESLLERYKLPARLECADGYVPLRNALLFVDAGRRAQGIPDFGYLVARGMRFDDLSQELRVPILNSPTLFSALKKLCAMASIEDTGLRMSLALHGNKARLYSQVDGIRGMPHAEHTQWIQNFLSIQLIREFAGRDWLPSEMAFEAHYTPQAEVREDWPTTRFISGQPCSWVDIPLEYLSLPPLSNPKGETRPEGEGFRPPETLEEVLRLILPSYLEGRVPTVSDIAGMLNVSSRSLQRILAGSGHSYRDILNRVRFERAAALLECGEMKMLDIALSLGYKDAAHFTRAFSKIAGCSPLQYRKYRMQPSPIRGR